MALCKGRNMVMLKFVFQFKTTTDLCWKKSSFALLSKPYAAGKIAVESLAIPENYKTYISLLFKDNGPI